LGNHVKEDEMDGVYSTRGTDKKRTETSQKCEGTRQLGAYRPKVPKLQGTTPQGVLLVLSGGTGCLYQETFILKEIEAQDKIYILICTLLGLNILLITYC
jgi:hypothetical protein